MKKAFSTSKLKINARHRKAIIDLSAPMFFLRERSNLIEFLNMVYVADMTFFRNKKYSASTNVAMEILG